MIENNQLKLIGINILSDCKPFIKKNLESNSPYLFYKEFELVNPNSKGQFTVEKSEENTISKDFFAYKGSSHPRLSFSAIVGKNGSGKSAIIDIVLRLINNLAFKHIPSATKYSKVELKWTKGIYAQLYFILDGTYFLVQQDGDSTNNIVLYKNTQTKNGQFRWIRERSKTTKVALGDSFFYTVLMNYSLYAFNTYDYKEEWGNKEKEDSCWLKGLFHKNDGYQTPAVLNPMRTKGKIDVNRENSLAKDRLISLFFNEQEEQNSNFTNINDNSSVASLIITPADENVERKYNEIIGDWKANQSESVEPNFFDYLKGIIITEWQNKYKFKPKYDNDTEYEIATQYLVYKTISIAQTYDNQLEHSSCLLPINGEEWNSNRLMELQKFITDLDNESSHITFKLRQTLAFLTFRHLEIKNEKLNLSISDFAKLVQNRLSKQWNYLDFVPAPLYHTEIIVRNIITHEEFPFTKLSSGERQMIYSGSGILYHLRNINSIQKNLRRVKYRHINIVLDEIELYFHPEYQRKYIDYLIKSIRSIRLTEIESINLLLATHSPFILSDIPESNVLFLDEGKQQEGISETFASNIHTLYKNNFFVKGMPIGEFAKNKIKVLFEKVKKSQSSDIEILNEINLVGEHLLKSQLIKIYNQNSPLDLIKKVSELEQEVKILRSKINDTNSNR